MNINSNNRTDQLTPSLLGNSPTSNSSSAKGEDREVFLKLLVAQLKNQDPLAPQDGAQFVAQLAQFSSLDQLISINQQLGELLNKK
ncbi:MAG: flagellar hook capping FlgD N-terminal domain-containing protein [Acidobacteriota bacterium]